MTAKPPDFDERVGQVMTALVECLKDAEGHPRPHKGAITCPRCGGRLLYLAKATAKGTIWGTCATDGCLRWMV